MTTSTPLLARSAGQARSAFLALPAFLARFAFLARSAGLRAHRRKLRSLRPRVHRRATGRRAGKDLSLFPGCAQFPTTASAQVTERHR